MPKILPNKKGFTLLEVLLVVAAISILAGIVIVAINPNKQLGDTRNGQRKVDVNTILSAIYQYSLDFNGSLPGPGAIPTSATCSESVSGAHLCATASCSTLLDLSSMTSNEKYLVSIPQDPSTTGNGSGYYVTKSNNNRITVCAPEAENGVTISATR